MRSPSACLLSSLQHKMFEQTYRVFQTPELLQLIFERLDTNDLLSSRKVCRHFSLSITASPRLAIKLFHRDQERAKPLLPNWLSKFCTVADIRQSKGRLQVVLHILWSPRRRRQLALIQNSRFLRRTLLAQPAPSSLRIYRLCNCVELDDVPLITLRSTNGSGLRVACLARVLQQLSTGSQENPCVCSYCGADGKLLVIGERLPTA